MTEKIAKLLSRANGHIEMDIDNLGVQFKAKNLNHSGLTMGAITILQQLSKKMDIDFDMLLVILSDLNKVLKSIECESVEQAKVMEELLRKKLNNAGDNNNE